MQAHLTLFLSGALIACAAASLAQPAPLAPLDAGELASIDQFVHHEMARQRIPGLELGIYSRGRILLAKGYGLANIELNVPVKPETLMQSGSVGKQLISAAIMMLVEEGKISLDDSIVKYFPGAPSTWKPILIRNLLSHTSGLSEYESDDRTGPNGPFYLRLDFTEDELTKKIEAMPIEWAPGEKWAYRNTNYVLLGFIIHKITGMPYAQFLGERIFKPLGMTSTRLISDRDIIPNRAAGYEIDKDGELKNQNWVSPTFNSTADGALYFNVLDLARWDEALYGTRLLKQSSLDRIWTVYPLNDGKPNPGHYGFGWMIDDQNGHKRIEHGGAWQGFTCEISRYPDDSLTVVVLTNLDSGHSDPAVIAHVVAGLVNPALALPKLEAIADNQPELANRLGKLLDEIVAGADIRPELSPKLAAYVTPEMTKRAQQRLSKLWPGGTLTLVKRDKGPEGGVSPWASTYRLSKGSDAMLLFFAVAPDGKIPILGLMPNREYE
ncbi:MAG TPA: serine hydrolase domain-containing protein [Terracidiphilus sp.]|nr:serine hydrolase domain-containing protein [Terracidiphilus sp.]